MSPNTAIQHLTLFNKISLRKGSAIAYIALSILLILLPTALSAQSRGIALTPTKKDISTPYTGGTYRAIIIGNNSYEDEKGLWRPLNTAVSDARAVEKLLRRQYGFSDILFLENATRRDVLLALSELSKRVLAQDSVLVYYAGHGYLDTETNKGYWVPVDAKGSDHTTFLRNSTIRDELSIIAKRVSHTLLISDSCFSGTLLRSASRSMSADVNSDGYYKKVAAKKSVQIISAGGVEYVDDDYQRSGHSPFTYFLINELKSNDKPLITASELSSSVEKAVANNVPQVPESGVLQGAGDELGEFIFIKVKVSVEVEGVPEDKVKVQVDVVPEQGQQQPVVIDTQTTVNGKPAKSKPKILHNKVLPLPTL